MKILVIHEVPYLKKPVYEYQDFAERLASLGHQVSVFDFDQTGSGEKRTTRVSKTCLAEVELTNTGFIKLPVLSYLSGRRNAGLMLDEALGTGTWARLDLDSTKISPLRCEPVVRKSP